MAKRASRATALITLLVSAVPAAAAAEPVASAVPGRQEPVRTTQRLDQAQVRAAVASAPRFPAVVGRTQRQNHERVRLFARCLVGLRTDQVAEMLDVSPLSERSSELMQRLANDGRVCATSSFEVDDRALRGALAEALLWQLAGHAPRRRPAPPAEFAAFRTEQAAAGGGRLRRDEEAIVAAHWAARCTVRRERELVAVLFASPAASPEEHRGLEALRPALAACALPSPRLPEARHLMRGVLAEAAYALLGTPDFTSAGGTRGR
jgi:hypothetical protein